MAQRPGRASRCRRGVDRGRCGPARGQGGDATPRARARVALSTPIHDEAPAHGARHVVGGPGPGSRTAWPGGPRGGAGPRERGGPGADARSPRPCRGASRAACSRAARRRGTGPCRSVRGALLFSRFHVTMSSAGAGPREPRRASSPAFRGPCGASCSCTRSASASAGLRELRAVPQALPPWKWSWRAGVAGPRSQRRRSLGKFRGRTRRRRGRASRKKKNGDDARAASTRPTARRPPRGAPAEAEARVHRPAPPAGRRPRSAGRRRLNPHVARAVVLDEVAVVVLVDLAGAHAAPRISARVVRSRGRRRPALDLGRGVSNSTPRRVTRGRPSCGRADVDLVKRGSSPAA